MRKQHRDDAAPAPDFGPQSPQASHLSAQLHPMSMLMTECCHPPFLAPLSSSLIATVLLPLQTLPALGLAAFPLLRP